MADQQNSDASVSAFVSSLIFTVAVSAALFTVFAIVRRHFPRVYRPKTYMGPESERPVELAEGLLGWVFGSRKLSELEFIENCGLDAYMFIEFLGTSFFLFIGFAILGIPILIPLNSSNQLNLVGLNQFTIANIEDQNRLWAHLVLTVIFCAATVALGMYSIRQYIIRRQNYLMSNRHAASLQATTILVCGIPKGEDNVQSLYDVFGAFPGGVKRIWLAYAAPDLQKDIVKRTAITGKLEAVECTLIQSRLKHHQKYGKRASQSSTDPLNDRDGSRQQELVYSDESFPQESRPRHRPAKFPMSLFASCCGAEKVDSIQAYRSELSNMNASILARQQAGLTVMRENKDKDKMRAAFIQFNHQLGAHLATQSVVHRKILTMGPRLLEVHPKDVLWDNLNHNLKIRNIRRTISTLLETALIVFWTIPVAFVASIANLDTIVRYAPFLSGVYSLPNAVVGIIQGILPPIGLAVLMMLLPIILYMLAHFGGEVLSTRKTLAVVTSYHWFSVVHVLLVSTLANGIFPAVQSIKDNPNNIMVMLASSLPQASTFFLTYILLSLIQIPLMLLQIGPLIVYMIFKKLSSTPRRMFATETGMGSVDWGMTIPVHTIAFSIGLLYSTIQPLILPFMVIYFGLFYLAFRHMFIYVYRQPYDSGGLIFPRIVDQIYVGVILFEIVMLGLFVLQKAVGQSVVMFIVLVLSLMAIIISRNNVFKPLIKYLPVEAFDTRGITAVMNGIRVDSSSASGIVAASLSTGTGIGGAGVRTRSGTGTSAEAGEISVTRITTDIDAEEKEYEQTSDAEKVNPIPAQESIREKAPYKDPTSSPRLEPETKEIYTPNTPARSSPRLDSASAPRNAPAHRRDESSDSRRSHYSSQSPLPSIRVESVAGDALSTAATPTAAMQTNTAPGALPRTITATTTLALSKHGRLVNRQESEYGGVGASSSLQVLGANHSLLSSSDQAAERVVPEALSYVNPAFWKQGEPIWLPKDPRGFAELEAVELNNAGLPSTTDSATMDAKGRIAVDVSQREVAPGEEHWE
ncbi:hypothetical protein EDD21DRAFT_387996 [Dissophora ornata]|nr:hypothetical protein BGZ58_004895 [Dissophora ornata]KAI8596534.1 hypothetical protein EDD21DRAFT_387996 [Dissophora ornata]